MEATGAEWKKLSGSYGSPVQKVVCMGLERRQRAQRASLSDLASLP